jgi:hypothetical protein
MKSLGAFVRMNPYVRTLIVLVAACSSSAGGAPAVLDRTPVETVRAPSTVASHVGDPESSHSVIAVRIAASIEGGVATDRPAYARIDQPVTLYAVIETDDHTIYSDAPKLRLGARATAAQPLAKAPVLDLQWNRIEPTDKSYSNTDGGDFHFTAIGYQATEIASSANRASIVADVRPTLTPDHGNGVGTMRFQLVVTRGDRKVASAGSDARRGRGSGGLSDAVMRVSIRRDDSYLGYLTEMYGQPYVWASAGLSDKSHQSERLEGSDCADFIVYGARRMGKSIAYTWTGGLPQVTSLLASGTRGEDGVYRDDKGKPVPFTRAGDLILFPRHVGALFEDRGTIGVLDDQDLMMHTLFDSPKQQPIADSGYADKPVELRRFR